MQHLITMLRLWYIFFLLATTIVAKHACDNRINMKTLEDDNNVICPETPPTTSFTSYVPQCWSSRDYSFPSNKHFKSHFNVVIPRGGELKVEYKRGETCGVVRIVCLRPISNTPVNDPHVDIDTCGTNNLTSFNIPIETGECIPAVQCQEKALYDTKIILTISENTFRPLSVFSLNGEELQYDGAALAEGRRTQALLTELDVREYKDRADALHYASRVDSLLDEYDNMAGIDRSRYKCLEIQAWRSGPGGAPAANLPICPTVFLRAVLNPVLSGYRQLDHLAVVSGNGLIGEFLTSNPATSWLLLHEVSHVYDAYTTDIHLKQYLLEVWNNILAGLYQARYSHTNGSYWLYGKPNELENIFDILRSDVAFGDLSVAHRAHVFIGLLNVDDDSSYLTDLFKQYYKHNRVHHVLEELVSMYLNRRVDPLPLMARVFSAERGNWFNITQFAQAISLNRRLSYDNDLNTFPKSAFSVTSASVHLKTNVSFSPEHCGTPYFTIDGILFNTTTVVSRANSLVVCLDTPNISNSITNLTKFIYLTDTNVNENIVINPVRVMVTEGLQFLGFSNTTWGKLYMQYDQNKLVFETYNITPHYLFDTVYADFTFLKENDEVIWQISVNGTKSQERHKELILTEVEKIQIYYAEQNRLKYTRTNQALTRKKNSSFILNSADSRNHIVFNPLHIMSASEGFTFGGLGHIWGSLDLRYDINKLVFEKFNIKPHEYFDTVYAHFTVFNHNDEVMWQVSIKGREEQPLYKELGLSELKKIEVYYVEPWRLTYTRTKQAISEITNSTFFIKPECGFAKTVQRRVDLLQRDVEHFFNVYYLSKFVELFKQSCVQNTL